MVSIAATTENTLGAILIGNIVAAFLYGMTTLQTYMYFGRCRGDSIPLRSLVAFLWILDTTHTVFVSHAVYTSTVARVGDAAASATPIWSMIAQVVVMGVNDAIIRTWVVLEVLNFVRDAERIRSEYSAIGFSYVGTTFDYTQ
ncbi:hypothetical protein L226DRAFT_568119 [Lentinus tigrinus ALCF2SS1-7]|uniref:uncharacterized protein n=1 Tax=Lentinus tigrinus ALCF2SS1-7 TaxID=1328758 RepID=UPI001165E598|nr:hypothetical protein L226DRAFT_568119 [Lentinus tigrinus ALCF2SS1-7]